MSDRLMRIVRNYEVKTRLGANGRLSEDEIRGRVTRYSITAAHDDVVLNGVRQVLLGQGVSNIMFPNYHAFSRELGKLTRQDRTSYSRSVELAILVTKWVARGLVQSALVGIAKSVFDLEMPTPPADGK